MDSRYHTFQGADIRLYFNGLDVSGDGRTFTVEGSWAGFEALDVTGAWSAAWEALAEGAKGALVVTEDGVEREQFDAEIIGRSIKTPYCDLATVSVSFKTV